MNNILKGKKTYIGITMFLLGTIGIARFFTNVEVEILVTNFLQIGGVLVAAVGRALAEPKE